MIILKHLTVERFRLLRELDLHFPQRGSILIQGPNESGKSALLESIYFALYGKPLASDARQQSSLDELISFGAQTATVTLLLSVSTTELLIKRCIERGQGQQITLSIRRLGIPNEEIITNLQIANETIEAELGQLTGEVLRNSWLIEQKGLARLELLSGEEREKIVREALGLRKITSLLEYFRVTDEDEQQLQLARERVRLAEVQHRLPVLSRRLEEVEVALDVVNVHLRLSEVKQQEDEILEQEVTLEEVKTRRSELRTRQSRIQQLKKAEATLSEIISAYEDIAASRKSIPELEAELAELERREQEELPLLEKRVAELSELMRSFGTLQRMSNDLLTSVDAIKELEQDLKQYDETQDDLKSVETQIEHTTARLQEVRQTLQELEERRRHSRPQLEARLERLQNLLERLTTLGKQEQQYLQALNERTDAQRNSEELEKTAQELKETEQELALAEAEAQQAQKQAEELEQRWRQIGLRQQLEEWHRLKGMMQGQREAQSLLEQARLNQERLQLALEEARTSKGRFGVLLVVSVLAALIATAFAIFAFAFAVPRLPIPGVIASIVAAVSLIAATFSFHNFKQARTSEREVEDQILTAMSEYKKMQGAQVAASANLKPETLERIEREITSLGGSIPRSLEEAQQLLRKVGEFDESVAEAQQQAMRKREEASLARNQVSVTMEAVARLRKEYARLEEERKQHDWDHLEQRLEQAQSEIQLLHQEITLLAGQEGLPLPSLDDRLQPADVLYTMTAPSEEGSADIPQLETLVESSLKDTEREIAALDGKLDAASDLGEQVKELEASLQHLQQRQKTMQERAERYKSNNPQVQLERAKEQQVVLKQALQDLNTSLRQRVATLGLTFGQAAVNHAEIQARRQLEELQITLGNKLTLQERLDTNTRRVKELQELLSERYKQLAKYSNSLGSWIVPPKPFAEDLLALRERCQQELASTDEDAITQEFARLKNQEGAAQAKIQLCRQEITYVQDVIRTLLRQHKRPEPKSYSLQGLATVWPLISKYTPEDQRRLEHERSELEKELDVLEKQEMALSKTLQIGENPLKLEQVRKHLEQLERAFLVKKHGNRVLKEARERLLQKVVPRTEYYMQQLLPLLTGGRYHDVKLSTKEEAGVIGGGSFQVSVWEPAANEYLPKSRLSAGTADQLSLALRLAFAIAILPRELGAAPGFILLDEPLSSFDRGRSRALVDVVTGDILGQHFEQIILISHSNTFDPAMFPYHVYMDNGMIVESNFPTVQSVLSASLPTEGRQETDTDPAQIAISAQTLS
ncbi:chromosome segregation ATPase [Thermosporothrix hazakensis]|jgi:DNA repair exonuclease SbcCD ATPase subunit|uniref:Nuclease SbcCD subunit C n=2 Tax=Thermosporothrix TaxID=768650 RepID=A0A326U0M1_THEHA|nr:AAA family ATPase [Thermosporothrix hazakensis]PZW22883.1 chromosome segregation ATPase [Thermosporothrix hazakensis]BBH89834.1 hypothetical protein KTC_45850 [Thermosporothrix sp. COM3]GCE48025.1 hypothetical protein KTH_28940 [Thermosporothrix hazakensis]